MPYSNKQMLRDANGDLIPQYWDVVEQEFKPLTGQNGANDVRLTGSKVEEILAYEKNDTYLTSNAAWRYFSNSITESPDYLRPIDVSNFSRKSIYLENNMNHSIRSIQVYGTSVAKSVGESFVTREDVMLFSFDVDTLDPGEAVFITEEEHVELKYPCIGLAIRTAREVGFDPDDAEGTITVRFYGSVM